MNKPRASDADSPSLRKRPAGLRPQARAATPLLVLCMTVLAGASMSLTPPLAEANTCPSQPAVIDATKSTLGPRHHPIGAALPAKAEFNQPDRCDGDIWYFDRNGNGVPDPGEVRVFGSNRQVDCPSCHGDSTEQRSATSSSVFLRQDAATLCLVCHNL